MTTTSSATFTAFQTRYKYRILGERDGVFSNLGPFMKEGFETNLLKSQRTRHAAEIKAIDNDANLTDAQKLKKKAETTLKNAASITRTISKLNRDFDLEDHKGLARAANEIIKELRDAAQDYTDGRADLTDQDYSADDSKFFSDLQKQIDSMERVISRQRTFLRQEKTYFYASINAAQKSITSIRDMIANFTAPAVDSSGDAGAGGDEGVDIIV